MTYAIAAAGTGGHVYPALSVAAALVRTGVSPGDVLFVGGNRLEATAVPAAGYPLLQVELQGLERSLTLRNLRIPTVVLRAVGAIAAEYGRRDVRAVLGLGGYVTVPAGMAARRRGVPLALSEQNAEAGLANRLMSRRAARVMGAFPATAGLSRAEWVGNPIRSELADFDRNALRREAMARYRLQEGLPVLGVFGGSLGAGAVNDAVARMVETWRGSGVQVVHLVGSAHVATFRERAADARICWRVVDFEEHMEYFYAVADLVVARAGGGVAELTATETPALLVPGGFGSGHHQMANARALEEAGAAEVLGEGELERLADRVKELLFDASRLRAMAAGAATLARPHAADAIAAILAGLHG